MTNSEQKFDLAGMRSKAAKNIYSGIVDAKLQVSIGMATCGISAGAGAIYKAIEAEIADRDDIVLKQVGCIGQCHKEPLMEIITKDGAPYLYGELDEKTASDIMRRHLKNQPPVANLLVDNPGENRVTIITADTTAPNYFSLVKAVVAAAELRGMATTEAGCEGGCNGIFLHISPDNKKYSVPDIDAAISVINGTGEEYFIGDKGPRFCMTQNVAPVTGKQMRIASRNCGVIDPESLDSAICAYAYLALEKAVNGMTPDEVISEMQGSGLRGRGGGGFSTGLKWRLTRDFKNDQKYVICNADEGDPGAFMDRNLLEGDPHAVIEGLAIAGYAIGASKGFFYIRAEYPLAIKRLRAAITQAENAGILGKNVMGTDFSFEIEIRLGAGAFVFGEETALIHSIEGERGMPRPRPPFPAEKGLWDCPTCINNVETLASVAPIIINGSAWYSSIGTEKSKGTKVFALAGKVKRTGLVEVPMGVTLRQVIFDIGGGIRNKRAFKAVQIGGPSGGCLPESLLDTEVDYDSLSRAGAIMGSGGMIVLDEDDCMVDVARYFVQFTQDESCGKCTPCREGTKRMLEILERITEGKGVLNDIELLKRLGHTVRRASLCGLGQTAPNPVLSTLRHFSEEYTDHVTRGNCKAGMCKSLLIFKVIEDNCIGCGACRRACPVGCISGEPRVVHHIDQKKCIKCGSCYRVCKFKAISRGDNA